MKVEKLVLAGSKYDAFLLRQAGFTQEGGPSGTRGAPVFVPARTGAEALNLLRSEDVDMLVSDLDLPDMSGLELGEEARREAPGVPVVVITGNKNYARSGSLVECSKAADYLFIWYGSTSLLNAAVRLVEDEMTFRHERHVRKWAALMLVEDDAGFASRYIPLLLDALITHATELAGSSASAGGLATWTYTPNRPLLLFRKDFESARECFEECKDGLVGVISDLEFPRQGVMDPKAGLLFTRYVKERSPSTPVIVQSHDRDSAGEVQQASAAFLWKGSKRLMAELKALMAEYLGFGDFVFRTPDGKEVARISDLEGLVDCVRSCPDEVFRFHGMNNHFSAWLFVHGEIELAWAARRMSVKDPGVRRKFLTMLEERLAKN